MAARYGVVAIILTKVLLISPLYLGNATGASMRQENLSGAEPRPEVSNPAPARDERVPMLKSHVKLYRYGCRGATAGFTNLKDVQNNQLGYPHKARMASSNIVHIGNSRLSDTPLDHEDGRSVSSVVEADSPEAHGGLRGSTGPPNYSQDTGCSQKNRNASERPEGEVPTYRLFRVGAIKRKNGRKNAATAKVVYSNQSLKSKELTSSFLQLPDIEDFHMQTLHYKEKHAPNGKERNPNSYSNTGMLSGLAKTALRYDHKDDFVF